MTSSLVETIRDGGLSGQLRSAIMFQRRGGAGMAEAVRLNGLLFVDNRNACATPGQLSRDLHYQNFFSMSASPET